MVSSHSHKICAGCCDILVHTVSLPFSHGGRQKIIIASPGSRPIRVTQCFDCTTR